MTVSVKPWHSGSVCPEDGYANFAKALHQASHHYADDNGKEWEQGHRCMKQAADIAINAAWPYWAMKRMYKEAAPLPSFDSFMEAYCRQLLAKAVAAPDLLAALQACEAFLFPRDGTSFQGGIDDAERMTVAAIVKATAA